MKRKPLREVLAANVRAYMSRIPAIDTQVKLAKKAGISQSSVARVLAGNVDTQIGIVEALASAIGVPPGTLLQADAESELHIDRERFASLPAIERAKIQSYIDFVMTQSTTDDNALSVSQTLNQSKDQQTRARRAAQRPPSDQTLSIDENKEKSSTGFRGGTKHSK